MSARLHTRGMRSLCALACACGLLVTSGCGPDRIGVPDVAGKTVPQAREALREAGLEIGSVQDFREVDLVLTYDCYRCR